MRKKRPIYNLGGKMRRGYFMDKKVAKNLILLNLYITLQSDREKWMRGQMTPLFVTNFESIK